MSRHGIPIGGDVETEAAADAHDAAEAYVTVGTASPGAAFVTPLWYNSAGTATWAWGGTAYVHIKASG